MRSTNSAPDALSNSYFTGSPPTGLETLYFGNPDVPLETLIYLPKKLTVSDMQEMAGAVLA